MAKGVTKDDVFAAADALLQVGEQPTIEKVRLHLGRGSPNTVSPHLKEWFKGLGKRVVAAEHGQSAVPQVVTKTVNDVWEIALETARQEWRTALAMERDQLAGERQELDVDLAAFEQEKTRFALRETDLVDNMKAAREQANAAESRLQTAEQRLQDGIQALKHAQDKLKMAQHALEEQQRSSQSMQIEHREAFDAAETRYTSNERRWLRETDELRQALKKEKTTTERVNKEHVNKISALRAAVERANEALQQKVSQTSAVELKAQSLATQLEQQATAAKQATLNWDTLTTRFNDQISEQRKLLDAKDRQIELLVEAAALGKKTGSLTGRISKA